VSVFGRTHQEGVAVLPLGAHESGPLFLYKFYIFFEIKFIFTGKK
jgi:hypothetical protein